MQHNAFCSHGHHVKKNSRRRQRMGKNISPFLKWPGQNHPWERDIPEKMHKTMHSINTALNTMFTEITHISVYLHTITTCLKVIRILKKIKRNIMYNPSEVLLEYIVSTIFFLLGCLIESVFMHGCESWTFGRQANKSFEASGMWSYRRNALDSWNKWSKFF